MNGRARASHGFTLVELMVSLTGGLFVAIAVFMLAKQATSLYQSEGRIGSATMGSLVGFERLRQDIERASFLSSPNIRLDPKLCGDPIGASANWPAYLAHLQGVMISQPGAVAAPKVLANNHSAPDEITLSGSFTSDDKFYAGMIYRGAANEVVTLQADQGGLPKLGYLASTDKAGLLLGVFGVGRAVRIVDKSNGKELYGTVMGVDGGPPPTILLRSDNDGPALIYRETSALKCGIQGGVTAGSAVNVVNIVHYAIRDMSTDTHYKPLFDYPAELGSSPDTGKRAELVREELDTKGEPIAGTLELVSEFAVDLKFGVTVARIIPGSSQPWTLETIAPGNPEVVVRAGDTSGITKSTSVDPPTAPAPQLVRSVRVRFGVRSREADRQTALDGGGLLPMAPGMYRIGTDPNGGGPYARVRTLQADIALHSQQRATFL